MNRFKAVKSLLMNAPVSLTMTFVAQVMNILLGHMERFEWGSMALSFAFSYAVAFLIGYFIPTDAAGIALAKRRGAKPGTWAFDIWVNLVVNTVFCVIMTLVMCGFTACFLGGASLSVIPGGFAEMIVPVWVCCFIVSLASQRPAIRAAKRLCGEDARP